MTKKWICLQTLGEKSFQAYLSMPSAQKGPGIILFHDNSKIDAWTLQMADYYAEEGYVVLVPDFFWRSPSLNLDFAKQDTSTALHYLKNGLAAFEKIGVLGFGMGGVLSYFAASLDDVACCVCYYPENLSHYFTKNSQIQVPTVVHLASKNLVPSPAFINQLHSSFTDQEQLEIYTYLEADSSFARLKNASNHIATQLAHSRSIALFRRALGPSYPLAALWDAHTEDEFLLHDAEATMKTMVPDPYVHNIPTMTGGVGYKQVKRFYQYHFIPKTPSDVKTTLLSRTIGSDKIVDEILFCFTHNMEMDWMLPGIAPTGKYVEIPLVAIVTFCGDKLLNEHIYWDQASVLVQIGLLDPQKLPIAGIETAKKLLDKQLPSNTLMKTWHLSEDLPL